VFFWDGRAATLEEQVLQPLQDPKEMNMTLAEASARVGLPSGDISRALASYVRSILSGNAPFDRFTYGDRRALSSEQQAGLQVFRGKGNCTACHVGPNFTDERFHNTGVAWRDGSLVDEGRFAVHGHDGGPWRLQDPTLREIARTAPYMHDGSLVSLDEVVDYYDRGGNSNPGLDPELRPLKLTASEKHSLVAFLHTLSGAVSGR
jgi:cytochrome c peroxidase